MSTVRHVPDQGRYEIEDGGQVGALTFYRLHGDLAEFTHTETRPGFEGRGLGSALVRGALDDARAQGWQVRPSCPFVRAFIAKHLEYADLVPADERAGFGIGKQP
jgi:predicted GNAT family acetyltransferase